MTNAEIAALLRQIADALEGGGTPLPPPIDTTAGPTFARAPGYVQTAISRHWPRHLWEAAARITECESGWRTDAHNPRGEDSRGLFQINVGPGAHPHLANENLYDPDVNAMYAFQIYQGRDSWQPWYNCAKMLGLL
jgi:hypothetical protein